jgi:hypothetical protein
MMPSVSIATSTESATRMSIYWDKLLAEPMLVLKLVHERSSADGIMYADLGASWTATV